MVQTSDGGFAIAGCNSFSIYGPASNNALLIKTDAFGKMQFSKIYGGLGLSFFKSVIQSADGGYALAGMINSAGESNLYAWLAKIDPQGNIMWNQTYGTGLTTVNPLGAAQGVPGDNEANSLVQTSDGGYALAGFTYPLGFGGSTAWIVKTDSLGNMNWNITYGAPGSSANSLINTSDDDLAFTGTTPIIIGYGDSDAYLVKVDLSGNVQWNQTFGSTPKEIANPTGIGANSLIETSDGGFALAGSANPGGSSSGYYYLLIKTTSVLPPPPSPSVPEFPSGVIVAALFMVIVALAVFLKRKKPTRTVNPPPLF